MAQIESLTADAIIALINAGTWPQAFPAVVGTANALNDQVVADVKLASNVVFGLKNIGTVPMAAGVFAFEASVNSTNGIDGDWVSVQAVRTDSNTIENARATLSLANGVAQAYGWEAAVNGFTYFRIRNTTAVTASSSAQWTIARGAYATEPIPAIQSHGIVGNVTVLPGAGTSFDLVGAATINASIVKASSGNLTEITVFNPTAAAVYLKLFNKATAPAPATDGALIKCSFLVPAGGDRAIEFGPQGKRFTTGIAFVTTTGTAATDVAAPATAGVLVSATYN